ncbi:uncharacterized protein LOC118706776 isoform X2 [Pipistrellus kuhlii]|uniref:uncharacterized protein LOC118706776 isoform X2 n=1 Tax=Pipistrellus kuhlii TaxID=59472 RepID=UPI001E2728F9|nr:uncharacterized protein LOC118706776 isoform X2 [Pipistrellus kuhlii]
MDQGQPDAGQGPAGGSRDSLSSQFSSSCCSHWCMENPKPPQRCCQTSGVFVIPKDCGKSEAEDCRTYTQRTPGIHLNSKGPQEICKEGGSGQGQVHPG